MSIFSVFVFSLRAAFDCVFNLKTPSLSIFQTNMGNEP
jgi:hypothetical protein